MSLSPHRPLSWRSFLKSLPHSEEIVRLLQKQELVPKDRQEEDEGEEEEWNNVLASLTEKEVIF